MRRAIAAVAALALVAAAAGCGGSSSTVTRTITTDQLPATAPTVSLPTEPDSPPGPIGEERLPPIGAVSGVRSGTIKRLADAQAFVDVLYADGDPTKPAAVARLTAAGYADGALRDQVGEAPTTGLALFRSYAFRVRDDAAAESELTSAVDEVRSTTTAPTSALDLTDLPGAQGLRVDIDQGSLTGAVAFVTFAAGPYVYGLQGVSTSGASLPEDQIVGAARDLYERVTAAP